MEQPVALARESRDPVSLVDLARTVTARDRGDCVEFLDLRERLGNPAAPDGWRLYVADNGFTWLGDARESFQAHVMSAPLIREAVSSDAALIGALLASVGLPESGKLPRRA